MSGNQYVWIPISHVNGEKINTIKDSEGNEHTIELARYTFDIGSYNSTTKTYDGTGAIINKIIDGSGIDNGGEYFSEETSEQHTISKKDNVIARDINKFKNSVKEKGGYYLARYEAGDSTATNNRDENSSQDITPVFKENQEAYDFITQQNAGNVMRRLYTNQAGKYESDLVNSYAWDTAIVFIQEFSDNSQYSKKNSLQNSPAKTGQATDGINKDEKCHIFDLAGNRREWTTETYSITNNSCTGRGASYNDNKYYTTYRFVFDKTYRNEYNSFRRNYIYNIMSMGTVGCRPH